MATFLTSAANIWLSKSGLNAEDLNVKSVGGIELYNIANLDIDERSDIDFSALSAVATADKFDDENDIQTTPGFIERISNAISAPGSVNLIYTLVIPPLNEDNLNFNVIRIIYNDGTSDHTLAIDRLANVNYVAGNNHREIINVTIVDVYVADPSSTVTIDVASSWQWAQNSLTTNQRNAIVFVENLSADQKRRIKELGTSNPEAHTSQYFDAEQQIVAMSLPSNINVSQSSIPGRSDANSGVVGARNIAIPSGLQTFLGTLESGYSRIRTFTASVTKATITKPFTSRRFYIISCILHHTGEFTDAKKIIETSLFQVTHNSVTKNFAIYLRGDALYYSNYASDTGDLSLEHIGDIGEVTDLVTGNYYVLTFELNYENSYDRLNILYSINGQSFNNLLPGKRGINADADPNFLQFTENATNPILTFYQSANEFTIYGFNLVVSTTYINHSNLSLAYTHRNLQDMGWLGSNHNLIELVEPKANVVFKGNKKITEITNIPNEINEREVMDLDDNYNNFKLFIKITNITGAPNFNIFQVGDLVPIDLTLFKSTTSNAESDAIVASALFFKRTVSEVNKLMIFGYRQIILNVSVNPGTTQRVFSIRFFQNATTGNTNTGNDIRNAIVGNLVVEEF